MSDNFVNIPTFKTVKPNDYTVTPFQVYKRWGITESNYKNSFSASAYRANYPLATTFKDELIPISSSKYVGEYTEDNLDTKVLWSSVNHSYYKDYNKYQFPFSDTELALYSSSSIFSLPQLKLGESIKPGSISILDYSINNSTYSSSIIDDSKCNLIDLTVSSESFAPKNNLIGYWGFNDKYKYVDTELINNDLLVKDFSDYNNVGTISGSSTMYTEGIETSGIITNNSGYKLTLNGLSTMEVSNYKELDNLDTFAISMWIDIPSSQVNTDTDYNYILSKQRHGVGEVYDNNTRKSNIQEFDMNLPNYPFAIRYNNNTKKVEFLRSNGVSTARLNSSTNVSNNQHHVLFQKSGSFLELYVNGSRESLDYDVDGTTNNKCKLFFGGLGRNDQRLSGSLDEVRIYNTTLSSEQIDSLSSNDYVNGTAYQTQRIGNVFYEDGILVISDPRPKYKNTFLGQTGQNDYSGSVYGFNIDYKSTVTLYEHEVVCKINQSNFNMSLNPSLRINENLESQQPKTFVSSSNWTPYITTVGLYNDKAELVAIGKLGRPIPKRNDVNMNIIVRFDS
jgi:hypothetical protein